jgi:hypothetical protein
MAKAPCLFEDLNLASNRGQVDGIGDGLDIQGEGTLKFSIEDDEGRVHNIKIPNSLYLPKLRQCLLLPQHWTQEAGDGQTWMGKFAHKCMLNWKRGKKTAPFNLTTNTPIFFTAPSSRACHTFASTFEALEAPYFRRETVLQYDPGHRYTDDESVLVPEEFVAEENINFHKDVSVSEGVNADNETVKTSNLLLPPQDEDPSETIHRGPLTFDPLPQLKEGEDIQLAATNNQAKLMCWHYRLGHLSFPKLKQLALNSEISKKHAKVTPPKCTDCLFGAMAKRLWQGKETKASHGVFIATKPGECISVDQMMLTEVGFYAQLKGKLTKKCYKCATIFVNHLSHLRFVNLQINASFEKTIAAKLTIEQYATEYGVKILHYHCNNGQFHDSAFQQAYHDTRQKPTFCGVNAHFQNDITERAIRNLSESACKQLLHACACWPEAVHFALWPYALCNAAILHNSLSLLEDGTLRLDLFS